MRPAPARLAYPPHSAGAGLDTALDARQRRWQARVHRSRLWVDHELRDAQRRLRRGMAAYLLGGDLGTWLTTPVIYSLLVPLVVLDLWVTLYQWICFPVYGVARVPRRRYFAIDRHRLAYLNGIEKLNCTFCSYANGLIAYVQEVAARTEQYWCPIKHARRLAAPHDRYHLFFDYGDAAAYRDDLGALRDALAPADAPAVRPGGPRRPRCRAGGSPVR